MKHLVFVAVLSGLLSACGGGGGSTDNSSPPIHPAQSENPSPTPAPECGNCEPAQPENRLNLTEREIEEIQAELRKTVQTEKWTSFTQPEKKILNGAWLYQATEKVKPLNWEQMNDEDLNYLMKQFFTEDLNLKDN